MRYFAAEKAADTVNILLKRANDWFSHLYRNGYFNKIQKSWRFYHGQYYNNPHGIGYSGEYGEYSTLAINHYRNIADLMSTLITNTRVTFKARSVNTDSKSIIQTDLADGLLDYYIKQKRVDKYVQQAVKQAIVLGAGYVKVEWNPTSGEIYDYHPETNSPLYEGDIEFSNLDVQDVIFDPNKGNNANHQWVLTRTWKNKYDLIAKFPEFEEKIKELPTKDKYIQYKQEFEFIINSQTDDIAVYEFFHVKTETLPEGRYIMFLSEDIVLIDMEMPYRKLPVFRVVPSEVMGTSFGYTPMFDLLPIQEAVNNLYSTIYTNQITFGVQNIFVPRGADINIKALEDGLNIIEGNLAAGKPEPINFTQTAPEIFRFVEMLKKEMETISGMNSVVRGDPEASIRSGSAMALIQSMALQYISNLQAQYVFMLEDIGTAIITLLRDFAAIPRVAIIAGKSNQDYVKREFSSDDLDTIDRVIVEIANPVSATTAGRFQMATDLLQYQLLKTPEDFFTVLDSGQLKSLTEDPVRNNAFIKKENEMLVTGQAVPVLATDDHVLHIRKHKALLDDPERRDPYDPIVANITEHIIEHVNQLRQVDPGLLTVLGIQPLPPAQGSQPNPQEPADVPASAPPVGEEIDPNTTLPDMPSMPNPPEGSTPPANFIPQE
ncbi:MAG: hypothetical protein ABIM30_01230 [candidate division WOR-3 bacterium]